MAVGIGLDLGQEGVVVGVRAGAQLRGQAVDQARQRLLVGLGARGTEARTVRVREAHASAAEGRSTVTFQ